MNHTRWIQLPACHIRQRHTISSTTMIVPGLCSIRWALYKILNGSNTYRIPSLTLVSGNSIGGLCLDASFSFRSHANKAVCYNLYHNTGGFAERNGASKTQHKEYPYRVLMVLKSEKRIKNIEKLLRANKPPIVSQIILQDSKSLVDNPLELLNC